MPAREKSVSPIRRDGLACIRHELAKQMNCACAMGGNMKTNTMLHPLVIRICPVIAMLVLAMNCAVAQVSPSQMSELGETNSSRNSVPIIVLDRWAADCPMCINYSLEIHSDGHVFHRGTIEWLDVPVRGKELVRGTIETAIDPKFIKEWVERLNELGFTSLPDQYLGTPCFAESYMQRIWLRKQGDSKSLTWQACMEKGKIGQIDKLAREVREVIGSEKLMKRVPDKRER